MKNRISKIQVTSSEMPESRLLIIPKIRTKSTNTKASQTTMANKRLILPRGSALVLIMELPFKNRQCQPMHSYLKRLEMW
jgi:hypothetical protein